MGVIRINISKINIIEETKWQCRSWKGKEIKLSSTLQTVIMQCHELMRFIDQLKKNRKVCQVTLHKLFFCFYAENVIFS